MTYGELLNHVKRNKLKTKWNVVSWLIGYQKVVTEHDWENIRKLYLDGVID